MRVRIIRPRSNGYSPEPGLREDVIAANRDQMGGRGDAEKGLRCGFGDNLTGAPQYTGEQVLAIAIALL